LHSPITCVVKGERDASQTTLADPEALFLLQAHGNKTAYAFMLDADFLVEQPWRLRTTAQRMTQECKERSVVECAKGIKVISSYLQTLKHQYTLTPLQRVRFMA